VVSAVLLDFFYTNWHSFIFDGKRGGREERGGGRGGGRGGRGGETIMVVVLIVTVGVRVGVSE
jgi:hypothetical protein